MKKLISTIYFPMIIIGLLFSFSLIAKAQMDPLWMMDAMNSSEKESEQSISLESLSLYWSANSYTPFGYQGRALPCHGDLVEVEADLKLSVGDVDNLQFSWFLDGVFQAKDSDYGRDNFEFRVRREGGRSHTVLVKIFNKTRSFYVEKDIVIPITNPELVIYKKNHGVNSPVYLNTLKAFKVPSNEEVKFLALPYFFNINKLDGLEFNWSLGKKSVSESSFTANVFGLKIINKEVGGVLEEKLEVTTINKLWDRQIIHKYININVY